MCLSRLGQIIYGALALISFGLILAAMFTNSWNQFTGIASNPYSNGQQILNTGILPFLCSMPGVQVTNNGVAVDSCQQLWNGLSSNIKVVAGAMILAGLLAALSFVWNLATFCACCCKGDILKPLPVIAGMAAVSLGVALGFFYFNNTQSIGQLLGPAAAISGISSGTIPSVGYSFYVACGALICCIANIVTGSLTVCLADKCL